MVFQEVAVNAPVNQLKMAIIGGGERCRSLLRILEAGKLTGMDVEIVGVADINPDAAGFVCAREQSIFTTENYEDLFTIPGLELIVNLTGRIDVSGEISAKKPDTVSVLDSKASRLFQEIVKAVLDSGEQIEAQKEELKLSHSFIRTLAEVTVVGAMVLDLNNRVVWINKAALKGSRLRREEALGKFCFQISHNSSLPCDMDDSFCPMKETLKTGQSSHAIHEHVYDDRAVYCDVSTFPLFNSKGEVAQVLEVIRDITEELNDRVEQRTMSIKKDLSKLVQEDKMISLGKMVASVAHEINNPIGSIINFNKYILRSIEKGGPDENELEEFKNYLELSIREAQRSGKIVNNLLTFSRQQPVESKRINLAELFNRIIALTRHKMELSNIHCSLDLAEQDLAVQGDYTQIQQCFTNFVFNSIEAMPNGGSLTIRAGESEKQHAVRVEITDSGEGIPEENIDRIFEPFFSTKSDTSGVGLGLSMVYGIIKEHRGEIKVDSTPGQGTTFVVTLPSAERETYQNE